MILKLIINLSIFVGTLIKSFFERFVYLLRRISHVALTVVLQLKHLLSQM